MITYTWSISQLERQSDTGGVVTAHWRVNAQDEEYSASVYGSTGFNPDPNSEDFVPFEQLTEEGVLQWVWKYVDKDATEAALAQQIELHKNPPTISGLPWQQIVEPLIEEYQPTNNDDNLNQVTSH